jgi:hypothetical protein
MFQVCSAGVDLSLFGLEVSLQPSKLLLKSVLLG